MDLPFRSFTFSKCEKTATCKKYVLYERSMKNYKILMSVGIYIYIYIQQSMYHLYIRGNKQDGLELIGLLLHITNVTTGISNLLYLLIWEVLFPWLNFQYDKHPWS